MNMEWLLSKYSSNWIPLGEFRKSLTQVGGSVAALALYSVIRNCYKRRSDHHVVKWAHRSYLEPRNLRNAKPLHFLSSGVGMKEWTATVLVLMELYTDIALTRWRTTFLGSDWYPVLGAPIPCWWPFTVFVFPTRFLVFNQPLWYPLHLSTLFLSSVLVFTILFLRLCVAGDLSNGIFIKLPVHSVLGQMLKVGKVVREPVYSELYKIYCR